MLKLQRLSPVKENPNKTRAKRDWFLTLHSFEFQVPDKLLLGTAQLASKIRQCGQRQSIDEIARMS